MLKEKELGSLLDEFAEFDLLNQKKKTKSKP